MPSIRLHDVSFAYRDAAPIFEDLSLHLDAGWTGVVGANGAGKTTLLALVSGALVPDRGHVERDPPGATIVTCPQEVHALDATIRALAESTDADAFRLRGRLGLDPDTLARWDTLSPGERKRWQVGAALAAAPDVLLLDEPTNHLDARARAWLVNALRSFHGVGLVVTHDRELLDALATRTLRVHAGGARVWNLPYSLAKQEWERELRGLLDARDRQQEEERRLRAKVADARREQQAADAARSTRARSRGRYDSDARTLGAKTLAAWAEARAGRSVATARDALERESKRRVDVTADRTIGRDVFVAWERAPAPTLVALDRETIRIGVRALLENVTLQVGRTDRIRIEGANGAGKSTLLNALVAKARLPPGRVLHLPQEFSPQEMRSLVDEVRALEPESRGRVLSFAAALGSDPARLLATERPSPGEARKLALASGLGRHAWLLALDEPTNHLDLPTIERLEAALVAYPGALVMVSHDARFAGTCTDVRWVVADGRVDRP